MLQRTLSQAVLIQACKPFLQTILLAKTGLLLVQQLLETGW